MKFHSLRFMGERGTASISFKEGSVMDFSNVSSPSSTVTKASKQRREGLLDFRHKNKLWLLNGIRVKYRQEGRGQISVRCVSDLVRVISSAKHLPATRKQPATWIEKATKNLIKFGVPERELKSRESHYLVIGEEWPLL